MHTLTPVTRNVRVFLFETVTDGTSNSEFPDNLAEAERTLYHLLVKCYFLSFVSLLGQVQRFKSAVKCSGHEHLHNLICELTIYLWT